MSEKGMCKGHRFLEAILDRYSKEAGRKQHITASPLLMTRRPARARRLHPLHSSLAVMNLSVTYVAHETSHESMEHETSGDSMLQ